MNVGVRRRADPPDGAWTGLDGAWTERRATKRNWSTAARTHKTTVVNTQFKQILLYLTIGTLATREFPLLSGKRSWQRLGSERGGGGGVVGGGCKICLADFQVFFSSFYLNPALTLCLAACHRDCFIIPTLLLFFFISPRLSAYSLYSL